ncbi:alginate lyase family protein [Draconibacterium sediminis]|uniref:Alginate lyase n=1 Tax=Draconibacterium sediminis TaxID=1544798 RepID=A0A0D8J9Z2_9BACT|nr:alginate lyase family protein [Draconibacterium sediminis]KJF43569.1 alginate lyase [Draconibacterium sediminis]
MNKLIISLLAIVMATVSCKKSDIYSEQVIKAVKGIEVSQADSFLFEKPVTVTASHCDRSAGGLHDFYSEGDYWWPDPENPDGPYIQKDGQSNPGNFSEHRHAMVRMSEMVATLTSAWLLTGEKKYADKAMEHLNAWFIDTTTMMNPNMLYAQAIKGRYTGRSIGLIDAYHFVEIAQSAKVLSAKGGITAEQSKKIKKWFSRFLEWMTTHEYGIKELNAENNHGTCWVATASAMAVLVDDRKVIDMCVDRFKNILLPNQMESDGSFPRELKRTKPYGYSLFNIDAFCNVAQILSTPESNLWTYEMPDGRSLKQGMEFIYPFVADKSKWTYPQDIYIWNEWPQRQSSLLFAGVAYNNPHYIDTYLKLPVKPTHPEVLRNLPVRHPVIWLMN